MLNNNWWAYSFVFVYSELTICIRGPLRSHKSFWNCKKSVLCVWLFFYWFICMLRSTIGRPFCRMCKHYCHWDSWNPLPDCLYFRTTLDTHWWSWAVFWSTKGYMNVKEEKILYMYVLKYSIQSYHMSNYTCLSRFKYLSSNITI